MGLALLLSDGEYNAIVIMYVGIFFALLIIIGLLKDISKK